jgi:hypothetical protein
MTGAKNNRVATTKATDTVAVDVYMAALDHPMKTVAAALRQIILSAHRNVGEEIYWKAPCFFYTGKMEPFAPKEYRRVIIVFNFFRKDCIRLIFLTGARLDNSAGLLTGDYTDGRRLALFHSMEEVNTHGKTLKKLVKEWVRTLDG